MIRFYLRNRSVWESNDLHEAIKQGIEGVERRDIEQVWGLWNRNGLSRRDFTEGVQWKLTGQQDGP